LVGFSHVPEIKGLTSLIATVAISSLDPIFQLEQTKSFFLSLSIVLLLIPIHLIE
jgi:hypothetical protein